MDVYHFAHILYRKSLIGEVQVESFAILTVIRRLVVCGGEFELLMHSARSDVHEVMVMFKFIHTAWGKRRILRTKDVAIQGEGRGRIRSVDSS